MPAIYLTDLDSLDELLGTDVTISTYGITDNPIGRIVDVTHPDTDFELGDDDYPYDDVELTIEDHLQDRTWTPSGLSPATAAPIGETYTLYYGEARQDDSTWERITDKYASESYARDQTKTTDTDRQTRLMTETYEVGLDQTEKFPLRLSETGVDCVLTGRNTLEEALATASLDQRIRVNIDAKDTFEATVTNITPSEVDTDAQSASAADGSDIPDDYKLTATDILGGTLTITYNPNRRIATVDRTPADASYSDYPTGFDQTDDPGELHGKVHGFAPKGNPVEYYNIPWLNQLERQLNTSDELLDELTPGSIGPVIGHVFTEPHNRFELHHATLKTTFKNNQSDTINDIVTVDTLNTYAITQQP